MKNISIILSLIILTGCIATPLNQRHYNFYYEAGGIAENNNDLELARQNYSRAIINAQLGYLGAEKEAWATYEWARIAGYLGNYEESKEAFIDAISLLEKAKGKNNSVATPMLSELGHLYHGNRFHEDAVKIYSQAVKLLEKLDAQESDPIGYALLLENYAESLAESGDKEKSLNIYQKAQVIREKHTGKEALYKPKQY